jgi:catechol 2,3-dioxygenase-like lactoylglutathione lyase family enzyme
MLMSVSTGIQVRTIDHITIVVADLERSVRFYAEVLGMERVVRPDFGFPGAWFVSGRTFIHMNVAGPEAGQAGFPPLGANQPARGFHFAFEVADCDQAAEQLRAMEMEIVTGPRSRPDGARQLYIYDPDGHLIELCSPPAAPGAD